jgi:hypothetical protein
MRSACALAILLLTVLGLASTSTLANWSRGGFACSSTSVSSWTAGSSGTGSWFGNGFTTTGSAADLSYSSASVGDERVLLQAIPMPAATTYQYEVRARFTSANQKMYWHVLAVQRGTTISLVNGGVPISVTQPGVKSLLRVQLGGANANGNWATFTGSFTISAADAAAYQFVAIALVASRQSGQIAQFDDVYTDMPAATTDTRAGLTAEWYNRGVGISSLNQIPWASPSFTTKEEQINWVNSTNARFAAGVAGDQFAVRLRGSITIPTTGVWTFTLGSDDGSSLRINGVLVLNQDQLQGFTARSVAVTLAAGTYPIEVRFFENGGAAGLRLSWRSASMTASEYIPSSAFQNKKLRVVRWRERSRFE